MDNELIEPLAKQLYEWEMQGQVFGPRWEQIDRRKADLAVLTMSVAARLVAEECAKLCDEQVARYGALAKIDRTPRDEYIEATRAMADAIRERFGLVRDEGFEPSTSSL